MIRRSILAGSALAMPLADQAAAQSGRAAAQGGDAEGRQRIAAASAFAILTSRLAASRGSTAGVKAFANFEIAEQTAIRRAMELASLATGQPQPDAEHAQQLRQLEALSGTEFDRMYLQGQLAGHRELLMLHQRSASSGTREEKIISTIAVAGIEQHIAMLQGMQASRG
ncbi:DUF4142 domain-containing protein [Roseococcus sp. YIM B11640]|uniref:DUF4142 domain-containing protein n=1 Tax=Roseococcus sp. YIM B11640 TaxID=3133973 RepID=UPI003C7E3458